MPNCAPRSVAVYSFGKTLHATGLRVGYAVAPAALTAELRKVHQFNTFTIATALQQAIARYLEERPDCGEGLGGFFCGQARPAGRGAGRQRHWCCRAPKAPSFSWSTTAP